MCFLRDQSELSLVVMFFGETGLIISFNKSSACNEFFGVCRGYSAVTVLVLHLPEPKLY